MTVVFLTVVAVTRHKIVIRVFKVTMKGGLRAALHALTGSADCSKAGGTGGGAEVSVSIRALVSTFGSP